MRTVSAALAFVVAVAPTLIGQHAILLEVPGASAGQQLGKTISAGGDVNNDGFADVIASDGSFNARVISGKNGSILYSIPFSMAGGSAGGSIFVGYAPEIGADLDNDGFCDFVVDQGIVIGFGSTINGQIDAYSGSSGVSLYSIGLYNLVNNIDRLGDSNGDGFEDLVVALRTNPNLSWSTWFVMSGKDGATLASPLPASTTMTSGGTDACGLGDINGDGVPDWAYSAAGWVLSPTIGLGGFVKVVSGASMQVLKSLTSPGPPDNFGHSIASAGDIDGDGIQEVVVAAPLATLSNVFIFDALTGAIDRTFTYTSPGVRSAGDANADGVPDVAITHSSPTGTLASFVSGATGAEIFASSLAAGSAAGAHKRVDSMGDVDGDGRVDHAFGDLTASINGANSGAVRVVSACGGVIAACGAGCVGSNGTPALAASGCAGPNGNLTIELTSAARSSFAVFVASAAQAAAPLSNGCIAWVAGANVTAIIPTTASGDANLAFALGSLPPLGTGYVQGFVADPGALHGFAASNALAITIAP